MSNFYLVKGDDAPPLQVALTRDVTGEIIDTTNKTVVFKFRKRGAAAVLVTLSDISVASQKLNGIAIFEWGLTDLDIAAGNYEAEIEITNSIGRIETVYEVINFSVREDF